MSFNRLPTFRFSSGACIAQVQTRAALPVTLDSAATAVMTDLTEVRAASITAGHSLAQAEQAMIQHGVRMLFVAESAGCVDGIVSLSMLYGDRPIRVAREQRARRDDLRVEDVMSRLVDLDVLDLGALSRATVRDLVELLQTMDNQHLLVAEPARLLVPSSIRGIISRTQVERQLGASLPAIATARSFAEIEQALA